MLGFSSVSLLGSVVRVESRQTTGGTMITTVTVAGDVPGRDAGRVIPFYQQVQLIGKSAELYANVPVGSVVFAQGTVRQERWQDKADPNRTQSAVRVTANVFGVIDGDFEMVADAREQMRLANGRNEVLLTGNLTRDADHRLTSNGNALTRLSVAVNGLRGKEPYVSYFDVSAWGDLAVRTGSLTKGSGVVIWCTIQNQTWDDRVTGEKRYGTGFDAREVMVVASVGEGEVTQPAAPARVKPQVVPAQQPQGLRTRPMPQATPAKPQPVVVDDYPLDEVDWAEELAAVDAEPAPQPVRQVPQAPARGAQGAPQPRQPQVAPRPQGTPPRPQAAPQAGARPTTRVSAPVPAPKRASPIPALDAVEVDFPESDELPF